MPERGASPVWQFPLPLGGVVSEPVQWIVAAGLFAAMVIDATGVFPVFNVAVHVLAYIAYGAEGAG